MQHAPRPPHPTRRDLLRAAGLVGIGAALGQTLQPAGAAGQPRLFAFVPAIERPRAVGEILTQGLPGVAVTAFGRFADFSAAIASEKPEAALALAESEGERTVRRKELKQIADNMRLGKEPPDKVRFQELWNIDGDIQRGLEAIAKALARKGNLSEAIAVTDELNQPADRLRLIKELGKLHVKIGREEQTLRWARHLSRSSEKVFALVGIATGLFHQMDKRKSKPASARQTVLTLPISPNKCVSRYNECTGLVSTRLSWERQDS